MTGFIVLAICLVLLVIAFLGCFIHKIPGPLIAFISILIYRFGGPAGDEISTTAILLSALAVILSMVLNRAMPSWMKHLAQFGAGGKWGAILGSIAGLVVLAFLGEAIDGVFSAVAILILSFGIVPFAFAYLGEFIARKDARVALKPALASYLTYLTGMIINLVVCGYCVYAMFMVD